MRPLAPLCALVLTAAAVSPAAATLPVKKAGGTAAFSVTGSCTITVIGPGKSKSKRTVGARGTVRNLTPGVYKVKTTPSSCVSSKRTVKVKKGKTVRATVLKDPKLVPTTLSGTFTGQEAGTGQRASWSGSITVQLDTIGGSGLPGFPEVVATYRVTALSGTWTIGGAVDGGCSYAGSGTFGLQDLREDLVNGVMAPGGTWLSNPWADFAYAIELVSNSEAKWAYTATCPSGDGTETRQASRPLPFRLLSSTVWQGLDPELPLPTGANPSGTRTWDFGSSSDTWTWNINADAAKELGNPT